MPSPANVATPATAVTVVVPDRVPLPGLVAMASVTLPVNPVAVFPCASRAVTCTGGVIVAPAVVLVGCTVNATCPAVPGVTSKPALVAGLTPLAAALSVYPVPALSTLKEENVAVPATAATLVVPPNVPPPAFVPIAIVTLP